jgi:hypothetical protein
MQLWHNTRAWRTCDIMLVTIVKYVRKLLLDFILNMQFYCYMNIKAYAHWHW